MAKKVREKKEKKEKKSKKPKKEKKPRYPYDRLLAFIGGFSCLYLFFLLAGIVLLVVYRVTH